LARTRRSVSIMKAVISPKFNSPLTAADLPGCCHCSGFHSICPHLPLRDAFTERAASPI
jgi:hypothetical protein